MLIKDLISQYVDTGIGIPRYQFDKLSSNDKRTYLRKMEISIDENPSNLQYYYAVLPEEKLLAAVIKDAYSIQYIQDPSEELQMVAVNNYGDSIQYITNPSEEVQLAAVKQNGLVITYILDKGIKLSNEVQMAAVKEDATAFVRMVLRGVVPSSEVVIEALKHNPKLIKYANTKSEEIQMELLKHNPKLLVNVNPQSENVQMALVRKAAELHDYEYVSYLRKPTNDVLMLLNQLNNKIMNINI